MDDQVWSWWGMWKNEGGDVMGWQTMIYVEEFEFQLISQPSKMHWDPIDSVLYIQRAFSSMGATADSGTWEITYSEWYVKQLILVVLCELGGGVEARAWHCSSSGLAGNCFVSHHLAQDGPVVFCWPCCLLSSLDNAVWSWWGKLLERAPSCLPKSLGLNWLWWLFKTPIEYQSPSLGLWQTHELNCAISSRMASCCSRQGEGKLTWGK